MFSWFWRSTPEEKKEEKQYTPEYLRERGKQLYKVDHSWRAKLQCFECLGLENARKHAGFTNTSELLAIKQQETDDRRQLKEERKAQLQNKDYLKKRYHVRIDVDNSWTAFFCGKEYARAKAGFDTDENFAINTWEDENIGFFSPFSRLLNSTDQPKEKKPYIRSEKIKDLQKKQAERKSSYNF